MQNRSRQGRELSEGKVPRRYPWDSVKRNLSPAFGCPSFTGERPSQGQEARVSGEVREPCRRPLSTPCACEGEGGCARHGRAVSRGLWRGTPYSGLRVWDGAGRGAGKRAFRLLGVERPHCIGQRSPSGDRLGLRIPHSIRGRDRAGRLWPVPPKVRNSRQAVGSARRIQL